MPLLRGRPARIAFILSLFLLLFISIVIGVFVGSTYIPFTDVAAALLGQGDEKYVVIVRQVRLPRVLMAALVGASLGVAGTGSQAVFRNPLGDPYLLGVSSGAALGAVIAIMAYPGAIVPLAFCFAIAAAFAVYMISLAAGGTSQSLILSGVAVGSFLSSITGFLVMQIKDLHGVYLWLIGTVSGARMVEVLTILPPTLAGFFALYMLSDHLNLMLLSDEEAMSLGMNVRMVRGVLVAFISLLTACAVAFVGVIGFVGLVIPHMMRLVVGANHRYLVPASFLFGASFLILADTLGRSIGPVDMPTGIMTAMFGTPLFIYLLVRGLRR